MRHWFLVLMIALLPLRGWVGDAMAVEMLTLPAHATMVMEEHGTGHDHCACDEHATSAQNDGDHPHSACDVCNGPALAMAMPGVQTPPTVHSRLAPPADRFASTEAQRGIKPPIS
ncbi:hypothetical protein [Hydrogenophaga sp. PBL-H3]|uniref:hypothetical protein n=1 Tax=Hydrogenophaga sp. PBL-H3 TaxID=434010 RepID=UPI00131FCD26|nr:hypothetical protein [Hydrogenophaga sp. PBL-H3]QHE75845.1 hypothetical protein F9Z45_07130 [Hydrogenophaga sp. PBL-H3]QHE80270.1 hypothetical protein F9Z44_07130 [Hydrogenophaga sp. PBL-H3]